MASGCKLRPISAQKRLSQPPASASLCSTYPASARPFGRCSSAANVASAGRVPRSAAPVFAASTSYPRVVAALFAAADSALRPAYAAATASSIVLPTNAGAPSPATVVYTATTGNLRPVKCCSNAAVFAATFGGPNAPAITAAMAAIAATAAAVLAAAAAGHSHPPARADSGSKFDVFLNFRGKDTRKNFTSHLYVALCQAGLKVYMDSEALEVGEEIWSALSDAIERSKVSVVVFSQNYATSQWCLNELTKIVECRKTRGQIVVPVFYGVEPMEVRRQTGRYGLAFDRHNDKVLDGSIMVETVCLQRNALKIVADLSGFSSDETRNEAEFVREIVAGVSLRLQNLSLCKDHFLLCL